MNEERVIIPSLSLPWVSKLLGKYVTIQRLANTVMVCFKKPAASFYVAGFPLPVLLSIIGVLIWSGRIFP